MPKWKQASTRCVWLPWSLAHNTKQSFYLFQTVSAAGKQPGSGDMSVSTASNLVKVGEKWMCVHCFIMLSTQQSARRHVELVHMKLQNFACSSCNRRFGTSSSRKRHEKTCPQKTPQPPKSEVVSFVVGGGGQLTPVKLEPGRFAAVDSHLIVGAGQPISIKPEPSVFPSADFLPVPVNLHPNYSSPGDKSVPQYSHTNSASSHHSYPNPGTSRLQYLIADNSNRQFSNTGNSEGQNTSMDTVSGQFPQLDNLSRQFPHPSNSGNMSRLIPHSRNSEDRNPNLDNSRPSEFDCSTVIGREITTPPPTDEPYLRDQTG